MSRPIKGLLLGSLLLGVGSAAVDAAPNGKMPPAGKSSAAGKGFSAATVASAPSVRLAAQVRSDGVALRAKGVASIVRQSTGMYCIVPSIRLNLLAIIPSVTVDFSTSPGDANLAQYASVDCNIGNRPGLLVLTSNGDGGSFHLADESFMIIVP